MEEASALFFTFLKLYQWYHIAQSDTFLLVVIMKNVILKLHCIKFS